MEENRAKRTKTALLWMNLSNEPFVVLYVILPFILRKDLNASILQLSILASLRPVLSIFSFYWSANLSIQKDRLRSNLISAWLLARLPFLLVPLISNSWYILFCCACYELLNKSGNPALIELLKINMQKNSRHRIYSIGFILSFIESIVLGLIVAGFLAKEFLPWQILLGIATLISLSSIFFQMQIPVPSIETIVTRKTHSWEDFKQKIITPWKDAFQLLASKRDFLDFQGGFMFGGIGLMLVAPSLSFFFVDFLHLSHADITTGRSILMGMGVTMSSFFWRKMLSTQSADVLLKNILAGFFIYLLCLYFAKVDLLFFYIAFFIYGVAQSGSHLLWNLSGPLFSGQDDSSQFSRVNILMIGIRGSTAPAIGGVLCNYFGPAIVILIGAAFCFAGYLFVIFSRKSRDRRAAIKVAPG